MSKPVMATLSISKFTLGILVWYLDTPTQPLIPQVVLTLVQPIAVESHPPPGLQNPTLAPAPPHPERAKGKDAKATTKPRSILPCVVFKVQGHPTQNCPEIHIIRAHMDAMDTTENLSILELPTAPIVRNKALRTNHACALCSLYGNYSDHCYS